MSVQNLGSKKPKYEVQSMSEVQNLSLKQKFEVCQKSKICCLKSETEVQSLTPKIQKLKLKVWNLKSKVCLKSVQSMSKDWIPKSADVQINMSEVLCPKSVRSLTSEYRILKSKIATKI